MPSGRDTLPQLLLPQLQQTPPPACSSQQKAVASFPRLLLPPPDYPPTVFLSMVKDSEQVQRIARNQAILQRRGSPVEVLDVYERQVYPTYFSDRGTYIDEGECISCALPWELCVVSAGGAECEVGPVDACASPPQIPLHNGCAASAAGSPLPGVACPSALQTSAAALWQA
jgi:hypothetical protein